MEQTHGIESLEIGPVEKLASTKIRRKFFLAC